jgi:membrane protease YdiL (CAAX protease family)
MINIAAYSGLVLAIFAGGLTLSVSLFIGRVLRGKPLLAMEPRRPVPWGLVDLLPVGLFLLLNLVSIAAAFAGEFAIADKAAEPSVLEQLSLPQAKRLLLFDSAFKLVLALVMIGWIYLRHRPSAADWGWSVSRWRDDLVIGGGTFLVIYLPTIAVQVALVFLLNWKYDHPLIELTTRTKDPSLFALAVFVAAIAAPLFEEFIFRGLIQGWLEKIFSENTSSDAIWMGDRGAHGAFNIADQSPMPVAVIPASAAGDIKWIDPNPYASPEPDAEVLILADDPPLSLTPRPCWAAIAISTILFSLMHFSHGPAWIPLLLFGAALGYVYQRTHSLWPGIIAHMLLNGLTMIGLWVRVFGAE